MKNIKDIRLKHYNYSANGPYFVTICSRHNKPHLVGLEGIIRAAMKRLYRIEGTEVDYFCIMPNHLHLIIILNGCSIPLGEIVRRLKAQVSKEAGFRVWQPNYYEHVIRNEKALNKIREYIKNNPVKEIIEFEQFYKL
ncbi:MAG: transposase [Candidatus Brocadiales bacterium]|nr:transposase [Candidatus Bathyanammoxibius sp.]MCQ4574859.1 transposase [Candidatus Bathyanammoxibius amoris]